jgi:hypothetical protein
VHSVISSQIVFIRRLIYSLIVFRVYPYLLRWRNEVETNTIRGVEHDEEEDERARMQTSLRNMIAHVTRIMESTRPEVSRAQTNRREYITNALLRKVSGAGVIAEAASG